MEYLIQNVYINWNSMHNLVRYFDVLFSIICTAVYLVFVVDKIYIYAVLWRMYKSKFCSNNLVSLS